VEGWWLVSYAVLWVVVAVLCATVVALARQVGVLHLRLGPRGALEIDEEGPALGETIDAMQVTDLRGAPVTIAARGQSQLLLFVSPGCSTCEQVLPSIAALAHGGDVTPVVLADADRAATASMLGERRVAAPVVSAPSLARALDVPGTPYVLVLDGDGVVRAKGTVNNLEQVEGLTETALRRVNGA
jgi:methylamine dehydrogenase accessory protein MauD